MEFVFFTAALAIAFFWWAKINHFDNSLYLMYKKAYKQYQKEVIGEGKSYQRYVTDFWNENKFFTTPNDEKTAAHLNESNKNLHILADLLQTRSDLVTQYFGLEQFTFEDFKRLNKEFNTTQPPLAEEQEHSSRKDSILEESTEEVPHSSNTPRAEEPKGEEDFHVSPETDRTFESTLTLEQIGILASCINEIGIFREQITPDELVNILACKPKRTLRSNNNRLLALFFSILATNDLITPNWQSVIEERRLFFSNSKTPNKYLRAGDLASALSALDPELYKEVNETINNYIKKVKKLENQA